MSNSAQKLQNMVCSVKSHTCQRCLQLHSVKIAVNKARSHLWLISHWPENLLPRCRPVIKTLINLPTQEDLKRSFPGQSTGLFLPRGLNFILFFLLAFSHVRLEANILFFRGWLHFCVHVLWSSPFSIIIRYMVQYLLSMC